MLIDAVRGSTSAVVIPKRLIMAGRGSESEASAPNYFSCLVEVLHVQLPSANEDCYSSSAISSPQSILNPAKDFVGAI